MGPPMTFCPISLPFLTPMPYKKTLTHRTPPKVHTYRSPNSKTQPVTMKVALTVPLALVSLLLLLSFLRQRTHLLAALLLLELTISTLLATAALRVVTLGGQAECLLFTAFTVSACEASLGL